MAEPSQDGTDQERRRKPRGGLPTIFTFLLIFVGLLLLVDVFGGGLQDKEITPAEFLTKLYSGSVQKLRQQGDGRVSGEYFDEDDGIKMFVCDLPKKELELLGKDFYDFVNRQPSVKSESELLNAIESEHITPDRSWIVVGDQDLVFLDYYEAGPTRAQRVRVEPDSGHVDMARWKTALAASNVEVERYLIPRSLKVGEKNGPALSFERENTLLVNLFWNIVPWLLIIGVFWFLIFRQMRNPGGAGGVLSFGRARPALVSKDRTGVTFDDVAGVEEAKSEVSEIVEFLKDPSRFSKVGARIPRGVLLVGQPGTGKTLLARAIAGEANVPFFSICGSDFVEMFVGVGASRVRDLFRQAREKSPCLIFLDEIDAVGRRRGSGLGGGHDEREQTLNAILVEMDGFETDEGIILIAATNRPDVLDPALLRPGRFDRQIVIDLPDVKGREAILGVHTKDIRLEPSVNLATTARGTPGFSGAELANLVNEAALQAALDSRDAVSVSDLEEARDRVRFGREKSGRVMDEKEKRITAYHEAGHALVGAMHTGVEPLHKVTIIPRGMALGATMVLPEKDHYHQSRQQMLGLMCFAYGGRLAEEIFCGDVTSGAYDDIKKATEIARMMVTQWGMSDKLGPISYAESDDSIFLGNEIVKHRNFSETTAQLIDSEVKRFLDECYTTARTMIEENREKVEAIAEALLKYETVHGEEIEDILEGVTAEEAHRRYERKHALPPPPKPKPAPRVEPEPNRARGFQEPEGDLPPAGEPAVS